MLTVKNAIYSSEVLEKLSSSAFGFSPSQNRGVAGIGVCNKEALSLIIPQYGLGALDFGLIILCRDWGGGRVSICILMGDAMWIVPAVVEHFLHKEDGS